MESLAESWFFWIALIAGLAALYILPSLIAIIRQVKYLGYVIALNLIAVGWPAALICAFVLPRREPRQPPLPGPFGLDERPPGANYALM